VSEGTRELRMMKVVNQPKKTMLLGESETERLRLAERNEIDVDIEVF